MIKPKKSESEIAQKKKTISKKSVKKTIRRRGKCYHLLPEHIEYICWEIAEFRGSAVTSSCIAKFPDYPPDKTEAKHRAWWKCNIHSNFRRDKFGNVLEDCKYKEKILAYRKEYTSNIKDSLALAHAKKRIELLQQIVELALEEKTIRLQSLKQIKVKSIPDKKDKAGNIIYKNVRATEYVPVPIKGRELDVARRALEAIRVEVGDDVSGEPPPTDIFLKRKVIDTDNSKHKIILPNKKHAD